MGGARCLLLSNVLQRLNVLVSKVSINMHVSVRDICDVVLQISAKCSINSIYIYKLYIHVYTLYVPLDTSFLHGNMVSRSWSPVGTPSDGGQPFVTGWWPRGCCLERQGSRCVEELFGAISDLRDTFWGFKGTPSALVLCFCLYLPSPRSTAMSRRIHRCAQLRVQGNSDLPSLGAAL